jgi:hypothetical protein
VAERVQTIEIIVYGPEPSADRVDVLNNAAERIVNEWGGRQWVSVPILHKPKAPTRQQVDELVRAARDMVDTITEARDGFRRIKQGDEIAHAREEAALNHAALNFLLRRYRAKIAPFPDPEGEPDGTT